MQAEKIESYRSCVNKSNNQVNGPRGQADALTVFNTCETVCGSDGDGTGTKLNSGDAGCGGTWTR